MRPLQRIWASVFRRDNCILGEGPFWYSNQLWWIDIEGGQLKSVDDRGNRVVSFNFERRIGAVVPTTNRDFLVAFEREIARFSLKTKKWRTVATPTDLPAENRFNDGKCDPRGRWLIGSTSHGHQKTSALYSLNKNYSLHRLRDNISISNGLAWSPRGETMYYIDTMALCVFAYDYELDTGKISEERIVLRFSDKDGWPDGMTIDQFGRLWIAFWDGWAVKCYHPATSRCEAVVPLPCARPTSCCFGGAALDRLYITTARHGLKESELVKQPLAGSLFVCEAETQGFGTNLFASQDNPT